MCGIAGYVNSDHNIPCNYEKIKAMTDAIKHRGPDDEGQWVHGSIALGHRRLSIIDLDKRSRQPMASKDHKYMIVFNGEIYNYLELRKKLELSGSDFGTSSDTEVIIEAYRQYGVSCFQRFNGMWAVCIYDIEKNQLIFSRDRFGIKPLYTLEKEDVFAFASEIKAITAAFPEENIPNETALYRYISGTRNENYDDTSFYKNVKIFPASHYMVYDLDSNEKTYRRYWSVDEQKFYHKWIEGRNPVVTFRKLFESAVELRLRSDVEVGSCLSGGIDSSAIVGCASQKFRKKMNTFSSVYEDEECNEEEYIREVNRMCGSKAHYVRPDKYEDHFSKYIKDIIYYHDGPVGSASLYSQYMVMKMAGKSVKVVLDGQGADELFAGYIPYYTYYINDMLDKGGLLNRLRAMNALAIVKEEWPDSIGAVSTDTVVRLIGVNNSFDFQSKTTGKTDEIRHYSALFTEEFYSRVQDHNVIEEIACSSALNTRLCNDVLIKSIPALLHNEDSNSMAFSIESRVPFLDYRIVEFAIALDGKYKIRNQWTKWIIRNSLRSYLPKKVAKRKNKMGFPAPFSRWLRAGKSKEDFKEVIYSFGSRNIVPKETIDAYYKAHIEEHADLSDILFKFYSAELWLRTCSPKQEKTT